MSNIPYASFNPIALGNLINVKINDTTLASNQAPVYDSTTQLYTNKFVSTSTTALTGLSGDAIVFDGSGGIKVSITGNNNYSSGASAYISRTTGTQSTAVGVESLKANTSGNSNVGVGFQALKSNTGGFNNCAIGTLALQGSTGNTNTAIGHHSLFNITSGSNNLGCGNDAGKFIADGTTANSTGSNSVFLGANTKASANLESNQVVIGHNAIGNGANSITLGNTLITKTIIPYGNIGIGTTTPTTGFKLDIANDVSNNGIRITDISNGSSLRTNWTNASGVIRAAKDSVDATSIVFNTQATGGAGLDTLSLVGGKVSIGQVSPDQILHLKDSVNGFVGIHLEGSNGTAVSSNYAGADFTIFVSSDPQNSSNDFLGFYNNSTTDGATAGYKMKITKQGNVQKPTQVQAFGALASNFTINASSYQYIPFVATSGLNPQFRTNVGSAWSNTNYNFTAPITGVYLVVIGIQSDTLETVFFGINPTSASDIKIALSKIPSAAGTDYWGGSAMVNLTDGDRLSLISYTGTVSGTITANDNYTYFQIVLLG